jgi:fimbrial isopeptide formation D2 family protein/uncharacterized repeat protein (TIGR01451 family)
VFHAARKLSGGRAGTGARRLRTGLAGLLGGVLLFSGWGVSTPAQAADFKLSLDMIVEDEKAAYDVGDTVTYVLTVKCDSLEVPCRTAHLTDELDANLTYGSFSVLRGGEGEDASRAPVTLSRTDNALDFTIGNPDNPDEYFLDGEFFDLLITATVSGVPTNPDSTIPNEATLTAEGETASDSASITVAKPEIDWTLKKVRTWPPARTNPALDTEVTYQITFTRPKSTGGVPISAATIVDTLPTNAEFVSAWTENPSTTGTYSAGRVTFTLPASTSLSPRSNSYAAYVRVRYPSSSFDAGDTPENTATASVTYDTGEATSPTGTLDASASVTLADPTPESDSNKWSEYDVNPSPGGRVEWTVYGHNTGNVTLAEYIVVDHLPEHVHDLQIVAADSWWQPTSATGETATFEYSTNGADWTPGFTWAAQSSPSPRDVPTSARYVRMTSPNLPIDGYTGFRVRGVVDDDATGQTISNCIDVSGDATPHHTCVDRTVVPTAALIRPTKTHFYLDEDGQAVTRSSTNPGEPLEWVLGVNVDSSLDVGRVVITDYLPAGFELVAENPPCLDRRDYSAPATSGCAADATYPEYTAEPQADGTTKLTFTHPDLPDVGTADYTYQLHLTVQPREGLPAGEYTNTMTALVDGFSTVYCGSTDRVDADGICEASDAIEIASIAAAGLQKWDKGPLEHVSQTTGRPSDTCPDWDGYTRTPCAAQTTPGGSFEYRLRLVNQGNMNLTDEVAYDILPHVGDTGVGENLSTSARKSEWAPVLDGPVTLDATLTTATGHNAVVEYNLTTNPCRPELAEGSSDADWQSGSCDSHWYTAAEIGDDWSTVKSYRIRAYTGGAVWAPSTRMVFTVPMRAPADAPKSSIVGSTVDLSIAWNSAAQRALRVNADGSTTRRPAIEPRKVGIIIAAPLVSIGDRVWYDANYNGRQDAAEAPAAGVTVRLLDSDGNVVRTTTTDADGYYGFTDLPERTDYILEFVKPAGYDWTRRNKGTDDAVDSDVNPANGRISLTTPEWTETSKNGSGHDVADDPTLDGGLIVPRPMVSVGDYTWYDSNRDGIQDAGEPVAAGVTVNLYDADGELLDTTTTDADGYYAFTDLGEDEQYTIEFIRPHGAVFTVANSGGDTSNSPSADVNDSDAPADGDAMGRVTFTTGSDGLNRDGHGQADNPGIDAGFIAYNLRLAKTLETTGLVRLGQTVEFTLTPHNDGPVNALAGWSVSEVLPMQSGLTFVSMTGAGYDCTATPGTCVASAPLAAGADGAPITVTATVDASASGRLKNVAYVSRAASDVEETNPLVVPALATETPTTLTDNDAQAQVLISPLVSIGDHVWYDSDRDGQQTAGEPVYPGMTVNLYDASGELVRTTTTDADGYYVFANLEANTDYVVEFVRQATETFTTQDATGVGDNNLATDADDSDATPTTGRATVTTPATGANRTGHDEADNPTIDAGIVAYNLTLAKSLTSTGPYYEGRTVTYQLVPGNDGPAFAQAGWSVTDVLPSGLTLVSMTGDGYTCSGATCTASAPLAGGAFGAPITVTATINAAFVGSAHNVAYVSPASGDLVETNPLAVPATGTDTASTGTDNDAQADITVDSLVSIGDYTWYDANRDGAQGDDEDPVVGMVVNLYAADGTTLLGTTTTDENGFYSFVGLTPNEQYVVEFVKPAHTAFTSREQEGVAGAADSNADVATGRVNVTAPASGANSATEPDDPTIDAGLLKLVSVGDFVWLDHDRNGTWTEGEPLGAGVTVQLFDRSGNLLASTVTDEGGYYGFGDLLPGEPYRIHFVAPDGYSFTGQDLTDDDADSDADLNGDVLFTTPMSGSNVVTPRNADDPTLDAGLVAYNLTVTKTRISGATVKVGGTVEYRLVPHNDGPSWSLPGWSVTDVLPGGLALVSMSGEGYTCTANVCVASEGLAPGADGPEVTVVAKVTSKAKGRLWNVAYIDPSAEDAVESNVLGDPPSNRTDTALSPTDNDDQAAVTVAAAEGLAYTGTDGVLLTLVIGFGLVAAGGGLLARRRRGVS